METSLICNHCNTKTVRYLINHDVYQCSNCNKKFTVLSTEADHVLYDGSPMKETNGSDYNLHR